MVNDKEQLNLISTDNLAIGYPGTKKTRLTLLENLNLTVKAGELIALIGPNGCGKSTLIHTLAGLISPMSGTFKVNGITSKKISDSLRAQMMGVVLTIPVYERNMTIYEVVTLGRFHYTDWLGRISKTDREIINQAIKSVDLDSKINQKLGELSDGERQRALIAKVLAQDVDLIILDEPTAHLDLSNRMELLLLLKRLSHEFGKGILLSTHELELSMQVSDKFWLVNRKGELKEGLPEEFILGGQLNRIFGNEHIYFDPGLASFELSPNKSKAVYLVGDGLLNSSVERMLRRLGFTLVKSDKDASVLITTNELLKEIVVNTDSQRKYSNLSELQQYLKEIIDE